MKPWRQKVYDSVIGRWLIHRYGPSVWRLPPILRRRMTLTSAVRRFRGVRSWRWRDGERVRPAESNRATPKPGLESAGRPYRLPAAVVYQVPRGWLVGTHAAAVTSGGRLLMSAFRDSPRILGLEPNDDLVQWMQKRGWEAEPATESLVDVCTLVSRLDMNYYHWIVESCGQIEALEHYECETGIRPKVVIRGGGARYLRESLELLGMDRERIIEWRAEDGPKPVERLVVPSRPGNEVACSPASLRWLRERFLQAAGVGASPTVVDKRLYVSRKQGGWRFVMNEDEVVTRLMREGFEVVRAEQLSLAEQIRLFSQANLIVGLHGAGLTNILFARSASVLELFGTYGDATWYSMTSGLGQAYRPMNCQPVADNVVVNADELLRNIEAVVELTTVRTPTALSVPQAV